MPNPLLADVETVEKWCQGIRQRNTNDLPQVDSRPGPTRRYVMILEPPAERADDGELLMEHHVKAFRAKSVCNGNYIIDGVSTRYFLRLECDDSGVDVGLNIPGQDDGGREFVWVQSNQTVGEFRQLCKALGVSLGGSE